MLVMIRNRKFSLAPYQQKLFCSKLFELPATRLSESIATFTSSNDLVFTLNDWKFHF